MSVSRLIKRILLLLLPAAALVFCFALYGPAAAGKSICISEICLENLRTLQDPAGNYPPYLELHNPSGYAVNLKGYLLATESFEYPLSESILSPGEYRVFFLNGAPEEQGGLPLRVSGDEPVFLYTPSRELLSQVFLRETPDDMSLGAVAEKGRGGGYVLQHPTPGEENYFVSAPVFSLDSGFYAEDQELVLQCATPGAEIHYTLDGSDPTAESILYQGPIALSDASPNPNVYSANPEISTGYMDIAKEYDIESSWPGYVLPEKPVEKCNVVKAIAVDAGGECSEITEGDYFIGISRPEIPVMELTVDPEGLFDEETGIYIKGRDFAEYAAKGEFSALWKWWSANYFERGFEWERQGRATLIRPREPLLSLPVGVRVKGQTSRAMAQKSLNIYFRRMYGEQYGRGMGVSDADRDPKRLTLFNGADSFGKSGLKDYLVQCLTADLHFGTTKMQPLRLYLDGEYWGFYYLTEKIGDDYIVANYSVNPENLVMVKNAPDNLEAGQEGDEVLYQQVWIMPRRTICRSRNIMMPSAKWWIWIPCLITMRCSATLRGRMTGLPPITRSGGPGKRNQGPAGIRNGVICCSIPIPTASTAH